MSATAALLLLALTAAAPANNPTSKPGDVGKPATANRIDVRLMDLVSIRRLVNALARHRQSMDQLQRAAAWADVSIVWQAVTGNPQIGSFDFDDLTQPASGDQSPHVLAMAGYDRRDVAAYTLLALGYSARETADVVSGRISQRALNTARQMLAVGQRREVAANYLDAQYKQMSDLRTPGIVPRRSPAVAGPTAFDTLIEKYATLHQVEPEVVRAIVATESAFNPSALSHAGAIGLMQLMPMTARELGVNPFIPEQNIEGGIRYFSQLLKSFGSLALALVAYNGGPGYAQRYARGQVPLYGETRDYVRKVLSRLQASR